MSQKLFIGNIPYDLSETDLKSVFEDGGFQVSEVKIITDKFTGKSRGFGFVSFENDAEAEDAINALNGRQVGGRTLNIAVAKRKEQEGRPPREPRSPREEQSYSDQGSMNERPPEDEGEGNF